MKNTYLTSLLIILSSVSFATYSCDDALKQDVGIYNAADNSGKQIKILESKYGVSEVYIYNSTIAKWMPTIILDIDMIQEYIKVKSLLNDDVWELFIDWKSHQIILVDQKKNKTTYWLEKA